MTLDVCSVIKNRLQELGLEQKDLAVAAEVTESYISQLLNRKKLPPAPGRTDIYGKFSLILQLPESDLTRLARAQRMAELTRDLEEPERPLLKETRELILRKCVPNRREQIGAIFERQPFGELERLVTRKLLDVVSQVARSELDNEAWLHEVAKLSGKTYEQFRVIILEFLDTDIYNVSNDDCVSFLDPLIAHWDIDLLNFDMVIALNDRLVSGRPRKFAFLEKDADCPGEEEPGLTEFLQNEKLSSNISREELEFLRSLRFSGRRPGALYYYRELQNLRDPLHFEFTEN